jgi:hypothetical protein
MSSARTAINNRITAITAWSRYGLTKDRIRRIFLPFDFTNLFSAILFPHSALLEHTHQRSSRSDYQSDRLKLFRAGSLFRKSVRENYTVYISMDVGGVKGG